MQPHVVVYGPGRTGQLIARTVAARDLSVTLAGRDPERVRSAASSVGVPSAIASTASQFALDDLLRDATVVVNTAGPLADTAPPLLDAAIRNGVHYLDVANEPEALAAAFRRDRAARDRRVCVVVGLGLGVAASEAAAAAAMSQVSEPRRLEVVFAPTQNRSPTPGVLHATLRMLARGPYSVARGRLVRHRAGWGLRDTRLACGVSTTIMPIFTGDLLALFRSQSVDDVVVYTPLRLPTTLARAAVPALTMLLRVPPVERSAARYAATRQRPQPTDGSTRTAFVAATAINRRGVAATTTLTVRDTSRLMTDLVTHTLRLLRDNRVSPGAWTPCQAIGPGSLLDLVRAHS